MAGFGAGCGWARCGRAGVRLLADETGEARPLTAQRQIMYPGQSASPSSHNDPQRKHTSQIQPPNPPPCERILTQRRRHSSHWHHCTVADGRPAHVKSCESRGTYLTTHTTCGTSPQKAQARRHLRRYMPIHTQRAADPRSPSGTLRIQPPAYATTYTTRRTQPAVTQDHQHPTDHACRDIRQPTPPTREHTTMQPVTTQPTTMQIPDRHRHSSFPAIRCGLNGTPI